MFHLFKIIVILFLGIIAVYGGKYFRLGRTIGGHLKKSADPINHNLPPPKWFMQKLDHSAPTDMRTWKQRYFVNDEFFNSNQAGPIFLMVGGEGSANPLWMVTGSWIEYAKEFNALCFMLEHRYYGESNPTNDLSTKNLQYLSSYQALADIANFIKAINKEYNLDAKTVKWVAFGGSYPGSLAAWLRVKFPHLVYASVSSSGPLQAKLNFKEYFEVIEHSLEAKTSSLECGNKVKEAHKILEDKMKNYPKDVEKDFMVCAPFSIATEDDVNNFFSEIADYFAELVQYNEDFRLNVKPKFLNVTINTVCDTFTSDNNPYESLVKLNKLMLMMTDQSCFDYSYRNMIMELRNLDPNNNGARQWFYQTCTEFGFYQTSTSEVAMFGDHFPINFFVKQCEEIFGTKFDENFISSGIEWTNSDYGSLNIKTTRVVYVHGSIDPWHILGLTNSTSPDMPIIFINGTAHCADMYQKHDGDSQELIKARLEILDHLKNWLADA